MKSNLIKILFLGSLIFLIGSGFSTPEKRGVLTLTLENIQSKSGVIWVGIYDSEENFMVKEKAIVEGVEIDQTGRISCSFEGLKYGTYAIMLFHDENLNGELDLNALGIPSEPFGFSGKPKSRWRLPTFEELKFDFHSPSSNLLIQLMKWSPF